MAQDKLRGIAIGKIIVDETHKNLIAEFDLGTRRERGEVIAINKETIRIAFNNSEIKRHRDKHNVEIFDTDAPELGEEKIS